MCDDTTSCQLLLQENTQPVHQDACLNMLFKTEAKMLPITHKAPNEQDIITSFNESYILFLIKLTIMIGSGDPNNPTSYAGMCSGCWIPAVRHQVPFPTLLFRFHFPFIYRLLLDAINITVQKVLSCQLFLYIQHPKSKTFVFLTDFKQQFFRLLKVF